MKPRSVESFHGMLPQFWGSLLASPPHVWGIEIAKKPQSGGSFLPSPQHSVKPKAKQPVSSRSPRTSQMAVQKRTAGSFVLETCLDSIGNWSKMEILLWNILISVNGIP